MRNESLDLTQWIELNGGDKMISPGKLGENGGVGPQGEQLGFTNFYMTRNGRPYIPVVGEFHYARFSYLQWEEELLKMKAGGIGIVATYVFWIFHEEEEGRFDWGGSRSLRHFVDLCAKLELPLILRIGPFCHGELRNGGIPDWVFTKPLEIRSNDALYLQYVRRLYREISRQVEGAFFSEGGPIIGIQLENEFMHCGAPLDAWGYKPGVFMSSGTGGNAHLAELRRLAEEAGMRPLFYTATAWGGAAVPDTDTLPMLAGYAYTPWIPNQPPSGEYIFRDLHVSPMEEVAYDSIEYPVAYCEMAGGMQVSYKARPLVSPESIEAMTCVRLASGSNLLGYYMYHGGTNPIGKYTYLNEQGLPKMTYDYQAPLGEFGRVGESYDRIRLVAAFLEAFGEELAPMGTVLPEGQDGLEPGNTAALRWCVRQQGEAGFVFINNFQDHIEMPDHENVRIELRTAHGPVSFPQEGVMTVKSGLSCILPFRVAVDGLMIRSATVQPLTRLKSNEATLLVFFAPDGLEPEIVLNNDSVQHIRLQGGTMEQGAAVTVIRPAVGMGYSVSVTSADGRCVSIVVLSRQEALQAYLLPLWGEQRLIISESHLYVHNGGLVCTSPGRNRWKVAICPPLSEQVQASTGSVKEYDETDEKKRILEQERTGLFQTFEVEVPKYEPKLQYAPEQAKPSSTSSFKASFSPLSNFSSDLSSNFSSNPSSPSLSKHALIRIDPDWPDQVADVFLEIDYEGDVAGAYLNGRMITDHIHYGESWTIGLREFRIALEDAELHLAITPLRKGEAVTFVNQALVERFEGEEIAHINNIRAVPHYRCFLSVPSSVGIQT